MKKSPQQRAFRGQRPGPLALPKIRTKAPRELVEKSKKRVQSAFMRDCKRGGEAREDACKATLFFAHGSTWVRI
jgi:hypothetical protein